MEIKKKFYVAADRIMKSPGNDWCHESLEDAIKHAAQLLQLESHNKEKWIVQVIKVVRRKQEPVDVEDVT